MNCRKARSLLSAFSKDELSYSEKDKLLQHLESCPGCRKEKELAEQLSKAVSSLPKQELSEDFNMKLFEKIHNVPRSVEATRAHLPRKAPSFIFYRLKQFAPAIAVTAVLALAFTFMVSPDNQISPGNQQITGDNAIQANDLKMADNSGAVRPVNNGLRGLKLEQSMLESLSVAVSLRNGRILDILSDEQKAQFGSPGTWPGIQNVKTSGPSRSRYVLPMARPDGGLVKKAAY